jgi:hypothetical protein
MLVLVLLAAFMGQAPVPRPFPGASPPPARPAPQAPAAPAPSAPAPVPAQPAPTSAAPESVPTEVFLGVPVYPAAQYLQSFDAGRGQRFYIFGSTTSFVDLVTWYRTRLKQKGDLIFDAPATHEFDVGRFREETMAFPPGVTIKEYKSDLSAGYPNPKRGAEPAWFPTLIQIVPVTER